MPPHWWSSSHNSVCSWQSFQWLGQFVEKYGLSCTTLCADHTWHKWIWPCSSPNLQQWWLVVWRLQFLGPPLCRLLQNIKSLIPVVTGNKLDICLVCMRFKVSWDDLSFFNQYFLVGKVNLWWFIKWVFDGKHSILILSVPDVSLLTINTSQEQPHLFYLLGQIGPIWV